MRGLLAVVAVLCLCLLPVYAIDAAQPRSCPGGQCQLNQAPAAAAPAGVYEPAPRWRKYLRQEVVRAVREHPQASAEEIQQIVLQRAYRDTVAANAGWDPDKILQFLERLIPWIKLLITIFG